MVTITYTVQIARQYISGQKVVQFLWLSFPSNAFDIELLSVACLLCDGFGLVCVLFVCLKFVCLY